MNSKAGQLTSPFYISSPVWSWLRPCQQFKVKWRCVSERSDKDNLDNVGIPSKIILNCPKIVFNRIFSISDLFGFLSFGLKQQEPTTKPSKRTLSTELLTALQEWPDVTVDKGKATDAADVMVAAVPADKAVDWATQVSLKLQKWVSARN